MRIGTSAVETGGDRALSKLADQLRQAADDGFASAWMANIFGLEALTSLAVAGSQVPGIELGTAVIPTYPRHPAVLHVARGQFKWPVVQGTFARNFGHSGDGQRRWPPRMPSRNPGEVGQVKPVGRHGRA